jgi:hypothetical protein
MIDSECDDETFDSSSDEDVMSVLDEKEFSKLHVFSIAAKTRIDDLARDLHKHLRWQSEERLPRTSFYHGITKLTKMQGHERTGVLLVLLIILVMDHCAFFRLPRNRNGNVSKLDAKEAGYLEQALETGRAANMIKSLALLLQYEAYMRWKDIPKKSLRKVELFIPYFMDQVLRAFSRKEGTKNNFIKAHLPLHLCWDIGRLGTPSNYNSGPGEAMHKVSGKEPGRRTNMNHNKFESQTATRYVENLAVERSHIDSPTWSLNELVPTEELGETKHGMLMSIGETQISDRRGRRMKQPPTWPNSKVTSEEVIDIVREHLLPRLTGSNKTIDLYTKTKRNGFKFYAHPCYGRSKESKQDWAFIKFQRNHLPCQLLCFLDIPSDLCRRTIVGGHSLKEEGLHAVVHCSASKLCTKGDPCNIGGTWDSGTLAHPDQELIHRVVKWRQDGECPTTQLPPTTFLVDCSSISGTCVGFPDLLSSNASNEFFVLKEVDEWGTMFAEQAVRHSMK